MGNHEARGQHGDAIADTAPDGVPEAIAEAELARANAERPAPGRGARLLPYLAIGAGAALGANLRYLVGLWVAARWAGALPLGTLLINLTGSFALGYFLALLDRRFREPPFVRLFCATGFLGAYTTFSSFSAETVALLAGGQGAVAALYIGLSIVGGYGTAWAGGWLARRAVRDRPTREPLGREGEMLR
jgi:CrcB protein